MERIIILGAGIMQGPAIRIARELGFYAIVADGCSTAPCISMADQFEQIDLKDKEGIEAFARSLQNSNSGLGGIMTAGTDFSATVAWVAEKLSLPGFPYEAALNASDKGRMRACFEKAGLPSPPFMVINREWAIGSQDRCLNGSDTLDIFSNTLNHSPDSRLPTPDSPLPTPHSLSFPLVVKPVDNMGGRGCRRVGCMEELSEAAAEAIRFSRSGRAIVEAYIDGPEFSVDAIVYHGDITICGLADRHIFFPPYFIEMGHTMPTAIAPEQQEALLETFRAGIRALGLADKESIGAAKGDIKLSSNGPMIGEIAARLSGGYMSGWTYPYASGAEPIRAAILASMGRKPEGLAPIKHWTSAERAFISIPGTVKAITGVCKPGAEGSRIEEQGLLPGSETAQSLPHIQNVFFRIKAGHKVNFPENNVSKCGNIITAAPDRSAAVEAAENAARSVLIRLDPADRETGEFLQDANFSNTPRFPPDAFQLSKEMREYLSRIPEGMVNRERETGNGDCNSNDEHTSKTYPNTPNPHPDSRLPTPDSPSSPPSPSLAPFPALTSSNLTDYMGRTVKESLDIVRELTGFSLPEIQAERANSSDNVIGRSFWAALVRGGYQGAAYYIDRLAKGEG